jgi:carbonic anhydrase
MSFTVRALRSAAATATSIAGRRTGAPAALVTQHNGWSCSCASCRAFSSKVVSEVVSANAAYAKSFKHGNAALPPSRGFAVLTCMDARLLPGDFAGLSVGDAHVIRNAGGRATDDAIRSLVISHKLLGTKETFVIHHTDCGMELFNDNVMGGLLAQSLDTATPSSLDPKTVKWTDPATGGGSVEGKYVKWHTFTNLEGSVLEDVQRIRSSPLINPKVPVYGYIYDVKMGKLTEVAEATRAGMATA